MWYFNRNLKPQGPFTFEQLKRKIVRGEVGPQEFVCKDGFKDWLPACEWAEFPRDFFPAFQKNLFRNINLDEKEWTLLVKRPKSTDPVHEGPFSLNEIRGMIARGQATVEDHVWRTGLSGWVQIKDRPECSVDRVELEIRPISEEVEPEF